MTPFDEFCIDCSSRLLLIVDTLTDAAWIEGQLRSLGMAGEIALVSNDEALDGALGETLDIVIASFRQPGTRFHSALRIIRERRPFVPVILISEPIGEELTADLFRLGISDFVLRSNLARLPGAIRNSIPGRRFPPGNMSEEQQLNLFEAISRGSKNVVLAKDVQGRYLFVNEAACLLFGKDEGEIIGRRDDELFSAVQASVFAAADRAVLNGKCSVTQDESFVGALGEVLLHVTRGAIRDSSGGISGTFAVALDVSERRRLEVIALAHSQLLQMVADDVPLPQFFSALVHTVESMVPGIKAAILLVDNNERCLRVAAAPGLPDVVKAMDGLFMVEGMASCGSAAARKSQVLVEDMLDDPLWAEFRQVAIAGGLRAAWSTPILNAGGQLLGTFALYGEQPAGPGTFHQLIIEMATRIAGLAIERSREEALIRKLGLAVEQNPNSIIITNTSGEIEYVNSAFEQMTGYSFEEVQGKNPRILQSGMTPAATYKELWDALDQGRSWQGDFTNRRKNGELFIEHEFFSLIKQPDGTVTHYLCIKEDITEKKHIAEELDLHRHRLEELVTERTMQLRRAKEEAEEAGQAKSTFLANMSHEIRTPLNAIVGLAHMLRRQSPSEEQDGKLKKIVGAADHLLSVINDILDISKIDAGKLVLESKPFDLEETLTQICALLVEKARVKGLEMVVDVGSVPHQLVGDATRLGQALLNYIGNAIKFTAHGTIQVRARMVDERDDALLIRFEVEDSGIGIEPAHLGILFQPFQQADSSITRRYGGTGLGLAISRNIARLMEGEVGASSTPGVGSIFWLTAWINKSSRTAEKDPPNDGLAGVRGLVVEDLAVTRMVLLQQLWQIGVRAEGVGSGDAALNAIVSADIEGDPIGVVLMDMFMPGMDGLDTLAGIQSLPVAGKPLCFLVTGSCDDELMNEARRAGFAQVLNKPVSTVVLHECLMKCLGASEREATLAVEDSIENCLRKRYAGSRVLLVEDEPINQMVAQEMLEHVGMLVDIACNGEEALQKLKGNEYRIVLMDLQMPKMGGLEATQCIRLAPDGEAIPIVAMTANAFNDDRDRCYLAGMNDFLPKPVVPEVLFAILFKWFQEGALLRK